MSAISTNDNALRSDLEYHRRRGKNAKGWDLLMSRHHEGLFISAKTWAIAATFAREQDNDEGLAMCLEEIICDPNHTDEDLACVTVEFAQLRIRRYQLSEAWDYMHRVRQLRTPDSIAALSDSVPTAKLFIYDSQGARGFVILAEGLAELKRHPEINWLCAQLVHDFKWWLALSSAATNNALASYYARQVFTGQQFLGRRIVDDKLLKRRLPALLLWFAGPLRPALVKRMLTHS